MYYYYHCTPKCGERFHAEEANAAFAKMLQNIKLNVVAHNAIEYFATSLYGSDGQSAEKERAKLKGEIEKNKERLNQAQQLLLDGTIDPADYKAIKNRYEPIVSQLESQLRSLSRENSDLADLLAFAGKFFTNLDKLYVESNLLLKQQLIGLMFPEKLIYSKKTFQTIGSNPLFALISKRGAGFGRRTHKKSPQYVGLSSEAPPSGLEPETL
ncbi:hypothetical protein GCM10023184_36790 [Flaviaesturariibacter amylovorans]|uniref:Recombinase zinc beta ribbon domain-containing protein n=2 Tax=Flaviaesturariibacter amylovorans TaxID=1084520 RepID=A0ABP8HIB0_9BACT